MFYSIPSSSDEVITVTPHGAKSVRYLFFENKNDKIFHYSGKLDTISISIDGKQIAQDIPIAPFCTTTPYGAGRFDWRKCALEVNLNVDNSEIKISGTVNNEYNIVFVCSDKSVDESSGFDFVEFREFKLKSTPTIDEAKEEILYRIERDWASIKQALGAGQTIVGTLYNFDTYIDGQYKNADIELTNNEASVLGISSGSGSFSDWKSNYSTDEFAQNIITMLANKIITNGAPMLNDEMFNKEKNIALDSAPEKMVVFSYTSPISADATIPMQLSSINLAANMQTGDSQELPQGFDLSLVSITNRIPFADAVYKFQEKTTKQIKFVLDISGRQDLLHAGNNESIANWHLCMIFIYKKLA